MAAGSALLCSCFLFVVCSATSLLDDDAMLCCFFLLLCEFEPICSVCLFARAARLNESGRFFSCNVVPEQVVEPSQHGLAPPAGAAKIAINNVERA